MVKPWKPSVYLQFAALSFLCESVRQTDAHLVQTHNVLHHVMTQKQIVLTLTNN